MRMEKQMINLGDTQEIFTNPKLDFITTDINGDNIVIWKKQLPEVITALFAVYIDTADNEDVSDLVKGIRRKLNIWKSRGSKNA